MTGFPQNVIITFMGAAPQACLQDNPNGHTIRLGGRYINISLLSRQGGFDHGYVSYILAGKKTPSLSYLKRMAACLNMSMMDLLDAIEDRRQELEKKYRRRIASKSSFPADSQY